MMICNLLNNLSFNVIVEVKENNHTINKKNNNIKNSYNNMIKIQIMIIVVKRIK